MSSGSTTHCIHYRLPFAVRRDFSKPRGIVKSGDFTGLLRRNAPSIVCVGDVVSTYCTNLNINNKLIIIIDSKTKRKYSIKKENIIKNNYKIYKTFNPPGFINSCSYNLLCKIIKYEKHTRIAIIVDGEEDLLALPSIACSPPGGIVVYGVPNVGAAIINVSRFTLADAQTRLLSLIPTLELT